MLLKLSPNCLYPCLCPCPYFTEVIKMMCVRSCVEIFLIAVRLTYLTLWTSCPRSRPPLPSASPLTLIKILSLNLDLDSFVNTQDNEHPEIGESWKKWNRFPNLYLSYETCRLLHWMYSFESSNSVGVIQTKVFSYFNSCLDGLNYESRVHYAVYSFVVRKYCSVFFRNFHADSTSWIPLLSTRQILSLGRNFQSFWSSSAVDEPWAVPSFSLPMLF